jgi:hypothetical protein
MQRITISEGMSFDEFRPRRKRGQRGSDEEAPEIYSEPISPKYRAIERDEPYLVEKRSKTKPESIMSKPDFEFMTEDESQTKFAMKDRPTPPPGPAPLPEQEDIVAYEDELPEEIDESEIYDMDVPEEEKAAPPEEPKPEIKRAAPAKRKEHREKRREVRREKRREARYSPVHEQFSGMPFLSQTSVNDDKTASITGILVAIGAIAVVGGLIYFLKRGS